MSQAGDKTEQATPHKLRKAKEKGQVARSRDLSSALGIVCALWILAWLLSGWVQDFRRLFVLATANFTASPSWNHDAGAFLLNVLVLMMKMVWPLCLVSVCIVAIAWYPGGWVWSLQNMAPKLSRLNPIAGLKRLGSGKHWMQVGGSVLKASVLVAVLWHVVHTDVSKFIQLQFVPLHNSLQVALEIFWDAARYLVAVLVLFALVDVPLQSLLFRREQRMSKQEVKEEHKTQEGRPEVKGRIRQIQRQMARQSIRKMVPTADVVITNPTHYAVALKYDTHKAQAPYVLAKGVDETAQYIREVAQQSHIEVLQIAPLARAIYHTSQVNQQIPASLYYAVAIVLSYIMQLRAFRQGKGTHKPLIPHERELKIPPDLAQERTPT